MYKKIYVEITNNCNLKCNFCIKNCRPNKYMSKTEFETVLKKIKGYTEHIYLHVLGEPLLHPNINEYIDCASKDYNVNITTNGYLINRIENNVNIRQLNISLHSYDEKYNVSLKEYMNNIFKITDSIKDTTFISFRFWVKNNHAIEMLDMINRHYNTFLEINNLKDNTTITKNVFLSINNEFIWPSLDNDYYDEMGSCLALKNHIGILADGTIVPCCLDGSGIINLGNIFKDDICDIINNKRYQEMLEGFRNSRKTELLCKKCPVKRNIKGL